MMTKYNIFMLIICRVYSRKINDFGFYMKKVILFFIVLFLNVGNLFSTEQPVKKILIKIEQYSDLKNEINSKVCREIANEVFDLVFNKKSELNEVEKLDLIFFMIHYQSKATEVYRIKLDTSYNAIKKNATLYFPISICHYCSLSFAAKLVTITNKETVRIPIEYNSIISNLKTIIISDINQNGENKKSAKSLLFKHKISEFVTSKIFMERIKAYKK